MELLGTAVLTTKGVVYGLIGTAIAQALVALVGFLIAGVPGAFLLAALTFILSLVPMGPVLIWGGAARWGTLTQGPSARGLESIRAASNGRRVEEIDIGDAL